MNIAQFFRIIWAHKFLIAICAVGCFAIGALVVTLVTPRYVAQSRVMLDVIKPDPVTGQVIGSAFLRAYTKTQTELIKGQQVARMVVKDLKWEADPAFQKAFRERDSGKDLDFTAWAAERVVEDTEATVILGSNILEISFTSSSPVQAKQVSDALLKAYIDITLQTRRDAARRNSEWYEAQGEKAKSILFQAEAAKAALERETGILLQDDKVDIDSARLAALANQGAAPVISTSGPMVSASASQLTLIDAEIAEATKTLGPNHPQLQQMKLRRSLVANQAAQERSSMAASSGGSVNASRSTAALLEQQKAKVMGQRESVERLRLMQDEIDLRREQYKQAVARAAQLRQEAEVAEAGATPLASAITPQHPAFPNRPLIMGTSIPFGAALGIVLGLLMELIGRRIRSTDDLHAAVAAPVLAVIYSRNKKPTAKRKRSWFGLRAPAQNMQNRTARA
jgi:succinoglycan biosynthesis transport protein ExoP